MAIKLVDELEAMGNFPIAHAEGINLVKTDGTEDNLQNLFDNGELGGGDDSVTLTQQEYEALTEEQKLDGLYYTYDTKRIYKNGVQYGASEPIPLTMEEYKALKEAGAIDEQQEYLIEANEQGILLGAEDIGYNNAESGIQATTVQGAIDKVIKTVEDNYAKTTDIPTTLPANGGNSDTVNNHTVKSDVPENAVFTDTIYDDTEVKGSIEEINSNLLGFDTIISSSTQTIKEENGSYAVNLGYFPRSNGKKTYKYYSLYISVDDGEIVFQKTYAAFEMSREKVASTWNPIGSSKSLDICFNMWDKNNTITIYNFRNADYTIWQPTKVICAVLAW